jgi:hypothetical protein
MKKTRTVDDLLAVANVCIEASEARARLLESHGKGPSKTPRRSRTIKKSTRLTEEIVKIVETVDITGIASSNPRIRKRRCLFVVLMM